MQPGAKQMHPDGSWTAATDTQLVHFNSDATMKGFEANLVGLDIELDASALKPTDLRELVSRERAASRIEYRDIDSEIVERWITERQPARTHALAARSALALFKEVTGGKTFANADRTDGELLVKAFRAKGNVSSTIKTKLTGLVAAVNFEMAQKSPRVKFNPFSTVAKRRADDTMERSPLDERDMQVMRGSLHLLDRFGSDERLMWMWCATTGARPVEVYSISEEFREETVGERPIRWVWLRNAKNPNKASKRRIPIPDGLTPYLPERIREPLFEKPLYLILIHIKFVMATLGISLRDDNGRERKTVYSLRHRAKDRLLAAGCDVDRRKAIMGHAKEIHDTYGTGFSMRQLKPWIELIGH